VIATTHSLGSSPSLTGKKRKKKEKEKEKVEKNGTDLGIHQRLLA
jgi:hypothetical protein